MKIIIPDTEVVLKLTCDDICQPRSLSNKNLTHIFACYFPCTFIQAIWRSFKKWSYEDRSKILFSEMYPPSTCAQWESNTASNNYQSCWINIFSKGFNCFSSQIKKTTIVNFYIFKNVWLSNYHCISNTTKGHE